MRGLGSPHVPEKLGVPFLYRRYTVNKSMGPIQRLLTGYSEPRVVHCKREPFDVYVGRPGPWGNPFSHLPGTLAEFQVPSREEAVASFELWLLDQPDLLSRLHELRGKVLGCWCAPQLCHGEILLKYANR